MRQIKRIAMIGAGSWGTAVAKDIAESKPHLTVIFWAYEKTVAHSINTHHENTEFLPGIKLPANIIATNVLKEAVEGSDVIILATPSKVAFDTSQKMERYIRDDMYVGFLTKGFCKIQGTVCTISQAMEQAIPRMTGKIVAISGPSHAEEVSRRFHTCLNVGSLSAGARGVIADLLTSEYVQARETEDVRAVEVGGTLKNPAAIAAGMISALPRCGDNLAGALMSEALKEMVRLGGLFGIRTEAMIDISGLGDLVATSLSEHSRNRRFGRDIAGQIRKKGSTLNLWDRIVLRFRPENVIERMSGKFNYLAEGAYAIEPLIELAEKSNLSIPVYRALYEVLLNKKDPSLLIETIKNPSKYDEIFSNTKIQISDRKKGLEQLKGAAFREMIITRVMESFVSRQSNRLLPYRSDEVITSLKRNAGGGSAGSRESAIIGALTNDTYAESIQRLAELYLDGMTDQYNPVMKWLFITALVLIRIVNTLTGRQGRIMTSGALREIRKIATAVNLIYVHHLSDGLDIVAILFAIAARGLPFPRFFLSPAIAESSGFMLRRFGGYVVDIRKLDNVVYRETLVQYLSTMAGHGVPMLYSTAYAPGSGGGERDEFVAAVSDCLYKHTAEVAMVPVEVSHLRKPKSPERGTISYRELLANVTQVHFSKPTYLSEYTKRPHLIMGIPGAIAAAWAQDRKIFPHYIICRLLADGDYSIREDALLKMVKNMIAGSGRTVDYSPAAIVKKGVRFLGKNSIAAVKDGVLTARDRSLVDYFAAQSL